MSRRRNVGFNPANVGWLKRQPRPRLVVRRPYRAPLSNMDDFLPGGKYAQDAQEKQDEQD